MVRNLAKSIATYVLGSAFIVGSAASLHCRQADYERSITPTEQRELQKQVYGLEKIAPDQELINFYNQNQERILRELGGKEKFYNNMGWDLKTGPTEAQKAATANLYRSIGP